MSHLNRWNVTVNPTPVRELQSVESSTNDVTLQVKILILRVFLSFDVLHDRPNPNVEAERSKDSEHNDVDSLESIGKISAEMMVRVRIR